MKQYRTYAIASLLLMVSLLMAQQFVTSRKKTPSVSQLKEQCAQELGDHLEYFAHVMQLMGHVQIKVIRHVYGLLDNNKENPLIKKNGKDLQCCHDIMLKFNEKLRQFEESLQEYNRFLDACEHESMPGKVS